MKLLEEKGKQIWHDQEELDYSGFLTRNVSSCSDDTIKIQENDIETDEIITKIDYCQENV